MIIEIITYFFIGLFACIIAALPPGLVNLSIIDTTMHQSSKQARRISLGAAFTEGIFAALAIIFGLVLKDFFTESIIIKIITIIVASGASVHFFFRKPQKNKPQKKYKLYFVKGLVLNMISLQVFAFWLIAIVYLFSESWIEQSPELLAFFLIGVLSGKLLTLEFFIYLAVKIKKSVQSLSKNINKIMCGIFALTALVQFIRILI